MNLILIGRLLIGFEIFCVSYLFCYVNLYVDNLLIMRNQLLHMGRLPTCSFKQIINQSTDQPYLT